MPDSDWLPLLDYSDEATKRTIKFSLQNGEWTPAYRRHQYEQYGAIQSWRFDKLLNEDDQLTGYIEFEDQQVAADLLCRGYICINDTKIRIRQLRDDESGDSSVKITEKSMLELPPGESLSENILEALNDDCLREIFRKLQLPTLHTVSKVCVRFNRIAKEIFRLEYRNETLQFWDVVTDYPISLQRVEDFLTVFGPSIDKLSLTRVEVARDETLLNDLLRTISKHCINIYALEIDYVDYRDYRSLTKGDLFVSDEILIEVRELFCRLKHLKLKVRHSETLNALLTSCSQLEILNISTMEGTPTEIVLPKLRSVHLDYHCSDYLRFLRCSQLKTISISDRYADTTLLQFIAEHFPNIDTLSLRMYKWNDDNFATNALHLGELKSLRCLRLDCSRNNASELMKKLFENGVELKCLELTNIQIDDGAAIDSISQIKSIEELTFKVEFDGHLGYDWESRLNPHHIRRLTQRLRNLNKLTLSQLEDCDLMDIIGAVVPFAKQLSTLKIVAYAYFVGLPDFNKVSIELTNIIRKREKPKKLTITIDIDCEPVEEMHRLARVKHINAINTEWLRVNLIVSRKSWLPV